LPPPVISSYNGAMSAAVKRTFVKTLVLLCAVVLFISLPVPGFGALFMVSLFVFLIVFDSRALPLFGLSAVPLGPRVRRIPSRGPPSA
jgi:hypothetical protein